LDETSDDRGDAEIRVTDVEEEYNSGPFCPHWSQLGECDDICAACGHKCRRHDHSDDGDDCSECRETGAECTRFTDKETP
jgi:hypothetical protein